MKRREFLLQSTLLAASSTLPFRWLASDDSNFTTLRRNTGTFVMRGGTIGWLINEEGVVIIDSQFPDAARSCASGLKQKTDVDFDMLINTHHHGDHTAGNPVFKEQVEHIIAHKNVPNLQRQSARQQDNAEETLKKLVVADITYQDSWSQKIGDETVHLRYYGPGHTGGDSVIYFEKANVAHMGDLVFNRAHPFIDRAGGASIENWITILDKTRNELPDDAIFIFGHGNSNYGITGSGEGLKVKRNYLSELLEVVQKGIDAGKTKEEISNQEVLKGFEEFNAPDWRLPLNRNLATAYDELSA